MEDHTNSKIVHYRDYVAGWLDCSIHDFLEVFPSNSKTMSYALITCLDSNLEPSSMLQKSPELQSLAKTAMPLGKGFLLPTRPLLETDSAKQIFFGFDEVWFFPTNEIEPKPDSAWLVGPSRINQAQLDNIGRWMSNNSCALGLGDGDGLNFIVKARGLTRHFLGLSLFQPESESLETADSK